MIHRARTSVDAIVQDTVPEHGAPAEHVLSTHDWRDSAAAEPDPDARAGAGADVEVDHDPAATVAEHLGTTLITESSSGAAPRVTAAPAAQPRRRSLVASALVPLLLAGAALGLQLLSPLPGVGSRTLFLATVGTWWIVTTLGFTRFPGRKLSWKVPLVASAAVVVLVALMDTFMASLGHTAGTVAVIAGLGLLDALFCAAFSAARRERVLRVAPADQGGIPAFSGRSSRRVQVTVWPQSEDPVARIVTQAAQQRADVVEVGPWLAQEDLERLSWELRGLGTSLDVRLVGGWTSQARLRPVTVAGAPALRIAPPRMALPARAVKRCIDLSGSAVLLLLLSPLLAVVAIAIKAHDRGPVFFRQERIGVDGKPFHIVKFRTMEIDADAKLFALLREQEADGTPLFKVQDDPRITRLGGFLRKYSIDELPQLFNVLAGTMSLVGPRPQRQEEVDLYTGNADHRLGVRPGMTGLWQVSGRSNLAWDQGQALDIAYAHNASLLLDARILIRTVSVVLRREGAV